MIRLATIATVAVTLTACGEGLGPTGPESPSYTITMPGNDSECGVIDFASCFAKVDMEFKRLYERNNTLSRRGEAEYRLASNSNNELATVFLSETYSVAEALRQLDRFISQVSRGLNDGRYSPCAGEQILARAEWLRAKLEANDSDMTGAPPFECEVSPVASVGGSGSTSAGVVLTVNDPYHYTQDVYNTGNYHTYTYFIVERQNGAAWDHVVTTTVGEQFGPETFTVADAATTTAGTYYYRVTQCDQIYGCAPPTLGTITVTEGGTCAHDNRNGKKDKDNKKPKCEKDEKEPKDHSIRKNG